MPLQLEHPFSQSPEPRRTVSELQVPERQRRKRPAKQRPSRRIVQEVLLRIFGAFALPAMFCLLQLRLWPSSSESMVPFLRGPVYLLLSDWTLGLAFFTGLAGAGYQAVARRRVPVTLVAGMLGLLLSQPISHGLGIALSPVLSALNGTTMGNIGSGYANYLLALAGPALFLFAAWCGALGTPLKRALGGAGVFALLTYLLFQLRDCFLSPQLWKEWLHLLSMALLVFVLPAVLLGGISRLLVHVSKKLLWLFSKA